MTTFEKDVGQTRHAAASDSQAELTVPSRFLSKQSLNCHRTIVKDVCVCAQTSGLEMSQPDASE